MTGSTSWASPMKILN